MTWEELGKGLAEKPVDQSLLVHCALQLAKASFGCSYSCSDLQHLSTGREPLYLFSHFVLCGLRYFKPRIRCAKLRFIMLRTQNLTSGMSHSRISQALTAETFSTTSNFLD